ncbi:MAG: hypothetical protein WCI59_08780 [Betaproteobacteria bacterium]|jgi:3-deoxy-7-phosphoheptulonate synthase
MPCGPSSPVGFKQGTDGDLDVTLNATLSVAQLLAFPGIKSAGQTAATQTRDKLKGHSILRCDAAPTSDSVAVAKTVAVAALQAATLQPNIMIDCSHGNSCDNHTVQPLMLRYVTHQAAARNRTIKDL